MSRAALLVSIAPGRPFTAGEQTAVREFVNAGGLFVSMTGVPEAAPSRPLLAQFGLGLPIVPAAPSEIAPEPEPWGPWFIPTATRPIGRGTMRFYAAWPVEHGAEAENLTLSSEGIVYRSVAVSQRWGSGQAVLLGDTCFAMNKTFEAHPGNSGYCKWLWAHLEGRPERPPKAEPTEGGMLDAPKPAQPPKKAEPAERGLLDANKPVELQPAEGILLDGSKAAPIRPPESGLLDAFKPAKPPAADVVPDVSKRVQPRQAADTRPDASKPVQPRQEKAAKP